ncbi:MULTISPECIES: fimbrial protein [Morganella]|uniref:fimbrial protein n=1 Tax=Morganella TaxID=581 RepID=UPI001C476AC6|nr:MULTISPECIES: fimbrial protein [Morganella]QXO64658.1 type 1 fimbrial protein [Morganella morganii]
MKKIKLALLVAGSLVAGASTSAFAGEGQGTVTFNGELTTETCKITSDKDQTIKLPTVSIKTLAAAGDEGGYKPFQIEVDCSGAEASGLDGKTVAIHFEPIPKTTAWDSTTSNLKNNDATGAKNVQVKIYSTDGGQQVHAKIGETGKGVKIEGTKKMTFNYVGGYYATAATTAGLVNATVMYTLVYQ